MAANRKTKAPSTDPGLIPGAGFLEDLREEIAMLWRLAVLPLVNVAGTANAITADCLVPLLARESGNRFSLLPLAANTGATDVEINGLPGRALVNRDGSALASGRLAAGRMELIEDDGTSYRLLLDKPPLASTFLTNTYAYQTSNGVGPAGRPTGLSDYPLNTTVLNENAAIDFSGAPAFVLAAGTYEFDAFVSTADGGADRLVLWDVVANVALASSVWSSNNYYGSRRLFAKMTLATAKTVKLRLYTPSGGGSYGHPVSFGTPEQYGFIIIRTYP